MPENLGPGGYNSAQVAINTLISEMSDLEFQRILNSESERFLHKHSSIEIADIQEHYGQEIKLIRNEMKDLDKTSDEYKDLMVELEELEDERDSKIKAIETTDEDREKYFEVENTQIETQYNAAKADKEALESMQDSNIKRKG